MILEGKIIKKNKCFGTIECDKKEYNFPLEIVYGESINIGDKVKFLIENDVLKIVTKYEVLELEEYLNVD